MEKIKKVFISQPMRGKTDGEILLDRERLTKIATGLFGEIEVIDNLQLDVYYDKPLKYLANDIEALADADIAFFAPGWELYKGCKVEELCARSYGIETYHLGKDDSNLD